MSTAHTSITELRCRLMASGYSPIPCNGKRPVLSAWEKKIETNAGEIALWEKTYSSAANTGILTRLTPTLDIDIKDEAPAEAVEELARERFEERGYILVRIGQAPKRAIVLRTDKPFPKIVRNLTAPNGTEHKIEILCDGQQVIAFGEHPDTKQPYRWHGGEPGAIPLDELPYVNHDDMVKFADDAVALLVREYGYQVAPARKSKATGDGHDAGNAGGVEDWALLSKNILEGRELHDSLCALAAKLIASGMGEGAAVNHLRGLMEASNAKRDERWQERNDDIPNLVSTAAAKFRQPEQDTTGGGNPVDLWGSFEPPTLPRGLLPKLVEDYAFTQGETMGVDPGGVAMAALAVCAAATPDDIKLMMKRHSDEWTESARVWVGLVGLPSTKKSPIISAVAWPLKRLDAKLLKEFLSELQRWEQMDKEERKEEPKPMQKRHRLEDTTIEAAQEALAGSPDGVLLMQDELSGFFGALDKYGGQHGAAKNRSFWLQSYNGGEYALNRIIRGVGLIPNLSVSLLGGIQPDVIRRLASESYDDGFLQRMLLIAMRPGGVGKDVAMPSVSKDYARLVERLTELRSPCMLHFDNSAQDLRHRLEIRHVELMNVEAINRKLAAHIGKYDGLFGRLCVAFHCIEHAHDSRIPEFITGDTAERVALFMRRFLLPHALAFYSGILGLSDDHERLASVAGYILAHKVERLTNRDVQRGCRTMRKLERRDTEAVFEQLEALGWVTRTPGPRPTDLRWIVNPAVHQKFAERAKAEAERRRGERAMIRDIVGQRGEGEGEGEDA
jgi:Protein of unknown function (DUF3987)/Bifunctional DNA primase/polymerase, N-terminal